MSKPAFPGIEPIRYQPDAPANALAFRYYDRDKQVRGKRMEDHLRMAVGYWHTFAWDGHDVFGSRTFGRQSHAGADPVERAKMKAAAAFELFEKLGVPYFCFHDRDVAPEGRSLAETNDFLDRMTDVLEAEMQRSRIRLLWGAANLVSHPRYGGGAATNPDPEVFTCAAAQVKKALEITHRLGGANFVLWGGCEGHEALLAPHMKRERDQLGRFMNLVVAHKHKIGFKGPILIEPTPRWHTKHHDHDTAEVHAFFQQYGLAPKDFKVNIAANQTTLAGQGGSHEFGSAVAKLSLAMARIMAAGGFTTGGITLDPNLPHHSADPAALFHGHVGSMDNLACALLLAESMLAEREALWSGPDSSHSLTVPSARESPPLPTLPIESMNVWAFLYTQCSRLPAPVVALLILAGLAGLGVVLSLAGSAVAAATVGAATGVLFKKVSSRLVG